jgi:hypothetical protein
MGHAGLTLRAAFGVVLHTPRIEAPLLREAMGSRRARGFGLERAVHALVSPVLLRLPRLDELRPNT